MKVCLLTRHMDFRTAGLGRVSMEIAKGLERKGHSVYVVSTNKTSLYSYFFYTSCQIPFQLPKGYDVYHAVTPMESMWIPKDKGIITYHDLMIYTNPDKLGSGIGYNRWKNLIGVNYNKLAMRIGSRCKGITAVSEQTKDELARYLGVGEDKVRVIRSGIGKDLAPRKKKDGVFRVGYLGALDRRKRVELLIAAFKESDLEELVIGGTGLDGGLLKEQASGDERIKFKGRVPDGELEEFYNDLDVFVFPTWLEGYGLPIVEAMACKKPVVVLEDAGIPWEVKSRCVIVDKLDYVLGNKRYLEGRCRSIDIEGNYEWAKEHNWDKAVDEYIKVYEEVLS